MSDDIAVLKDGRLVETGPSEAFFAGPRAAYSRDLLTQTPTVRFDAPAAWPGASGSQDPERCNGRAFCGVL